MSNDEKDAPEFVAVTPRAGRDAAAPEPEADPAPEPTEAEVSVPAANDAEPAESDPRSPESESAEAESESAEPEPEAAVESDGVADEPEAASDDAGEAEPGEAEASAEPEASDAEESASTDSAAEPDAAPTTPVAALKWTPPSLERPASPAEPENTAKAEPEVLPESAGDTDSEVSVRVAAEGMAAALSGEPSPAVESDRDSTVSVGPVAILTAVCVVLAIAAGALLAITARSNSHHAAISAARVAALDAAKREAALALTYDYRTLDADFQRAEAGMSRKFRANYAKTASTEVAPLAKQTHAISTGTIAAAGIVSATPNTARIVVFANQVVQNQQLNATSRLDRSVIDVRMVKENGRWVLDDLLPF